MRTAAIACFSAVMLLSGAAAAVERAAVYAGKSGVDDDAAARYRGAFAERLRAGGFIVVEVQGTVDAPGPFVKTLDLSLGRHGPYRLFAVSAAPRGKRVAVKIAEVDPKSLRTLDAVTALVADPAEFERVLTPLVKTFIPEIDAPGRQAPLPSPSAEARPTPAPAPPPVYLAPPAPPERSLFADAPREQTCFKEPGEFLWGLGVRAGIPLAGEAQSELGLSLRFAFETEHARYDIEGGALGGGDSRLYDITAGASYLFSTSPTSFYLGGGAGVLWMYGHDAIQFLGRGVGVDARAGFEFLRHHRARFLVEGRLILPLFKQDPEYSYKASQWMPATTLMLQALW